MTEFIQEHLASLIVAWSLFLVLAGFAYGYKKAREHTEAGRENLDGPPPLPFDPPRLSDEVKSRIEEALRSGRRIEAVKILREETGLDLARAKSYIDTMAHRLNGG